LRASITLNSDVGQVFNAQRALLKELQFAEKDESKHKADDKDKKSVKDDNLKYIPTGR
jgi:hypothetical protein